MRPTRELTTPAGKALVLQTYLSARECRELRLTQEKYMRFTMDLQSQKPVMPEVDLATVAKDSEDSLIRFAVVSYDGVMENVLDTLLDAQSGEFEFVLAEVKKLQENPKEQK